MQFNYLIKCKGALLLLAVVFVLISSGMSYAYSSGIYKVAISNAITETDKGTLKNVFANISTSNFKDPLNTTKYSEINKDLKSINSNVENIRTCFINSQKANEGIIDFERSINNEDRSKLKKVYDTANSILKEQTTTIIAKLAEIDKNTSKLEQMSTQASQSNLKQLFDELKASLAILKMISKDINTETNLVENINDDGNGTRKFAGINFGVGVSLTIDIGNEDRIESASAENGIVRVTKSKNSIPRVILESHYFFMTNKKFLGLVDNNNWGWGPFVAIQPGTSDIIDAIGWGLMTGFRRSKESSSSWNFGCGMIVDPNAKILGSGVVANKPLPSGESQVRYEERSQWGVLLFSSFTF